MLKVCFQNMGTNQKVWVTFSASSKELQRISEQLGTESSIEIAEAESDSWALSAHLVGKTVVSETGYKEVDFLERRMECLTGKEQEIFQAALEIERPYTLAEMVNLSCNLDKFDLYEGATDETKLGEYLLDNSDEITEELQAILDPKLVG